jgi:divalent metal cation (Fe/Co/Zn/Cd) transporter
LSLDENIKVDGLYRKGLFLEYFTVGYNLLEAVASIVFGALAGSIALIGFGLDSIVESFSGLVLIWRLRQHGKISAEDEERIERKATRFVAVTFFVLGSYVLFESVKKLVLVEAPEPSLPGIIIALVSLVVMPFLAWQIACAFLSVALLLGLGANYLFGFWSADPVVGLVIVAFLFREGWLTWRESDEKEYASNEGVR